MVEPAISVVIPTYRRPEKMARMISALEAQTLDRSQFEVIVVDNCSDDDTPAILADLAAASPLNMRILRTPVNRGPAAARNLGWKSARAPLLAFTDDDCVPQPKWLAAGLETMLADPTMGVAQGCTHPDGPTSDWTVWREVLEPSPWFEACNVFYRKDAVERVGGFEEAMGWGGEDTMLGWGVLEQGGPHGFAEQAVILHDNESRGLKTFIRYAWLEGRLCTVAKRYPDFRKAIWRPWAVNPYNFAYVVALTGALLGLFWKRPFLLLMLPYLKMRNPGVQHPRYFHYLGERIVVDSACFAGMKVGAVRDRVLLI